jgi:hypothetical protein
LGVIRVWSDTAMVIPAGEAVVIGYNTEMILESLFYDEMLINLFIGFVFLHV